MNTADSEDKLIAKVVMVLAICLTMFLVSLVWATAWYHREKMRLVTEHGYKQVQTVHIGGSGVYWTKE